MTREIHIEKGLGEITWRRHLMPEMTAEERALRIAPEGCNGEHPKGGCLFERVRDEIFAARREGEERMRERAEDEIKDTIKGVEMEATDVRDALFGALGRVHTLRYEGCSTVGEERLQQSYPPGGSGEGV